MAEHADEPRLVHALVVLTVTTGLVDAVSYLGLGHVFTANMTGNVVFLGFGIAGGGGLPVVAPLVSLGAFLVGAAAGGMLAKRLADRRLIQLSSALAIEASLVGTATIFALLANVQPLAFSGDAVIAALALAMGVRNATVRRIGVPDMTTTVLTMTLTGLAADSRRAGGSGKASSRRLTAVLAMFGGSLSGALLLKTSLALALAGAAVLTFASWLFYVWPAIRGRAAGRP